MTLADADNDIAVVAGLADRAMRACASRPGLEKHRQSLDRNTRKGRKNLRSLNNLLFRSLDWIRDEGFASIEAARNAHGVLLTTDVPELRSALRSYLTGGIGGLLLSWFAGWLIELVVGLVIDWILSVESQAWRMAARKGAA